MSFRGSKSTNTMEETEPQTVKTFSYDDNNNNESDEDEDEQNDDEASVSSRGGNRRKNDKDDKPFWMEHFWAIVTAFFAASAAHLYNQRVLNGTKELSSAPTSFPYLPPLDDSADAHDHLEHFERTSDIYFCHPPPSVHPLDSHLKVMEFYISRQHFSTLETLYMDDETKEDSVPTPAVIPNSHYRCLMQQHLNNPEGLKFKAWTYVYRNPTLDEMYPESTETDNGDDKGRPVNSLQPTSGSNKDAAAQRKRKLQQPHLSFTGFAAKFINLSPKPVLLYWDGKGGHDKSRRLVGEIAPFESIGTATMPGQGFHVTSLVDKSTALQRWVVTAETSLVYYEPISPDEMNDSGLKYDPPEYAKYQKQLLNREFARDYTISSGRTWLGNFPRQFPLFHMQPAPYIGHEYPIEQGLSLRVASVTPRVFIIDNFLTKEECQQVIQQGQEHGMVLSTLHSSSAGKANQTTDTSTRSSTNTWLTRDHSSVTEKVYERAAMVTKIDPELMQKFHLSSPAHHSIAESLQVVRYKKGEEYTPHHDFVYPQVDDRFQGTRYATLLIYLNTVKEGGETRFPRAMNNKNAHGLEIAPKAGTAVLFYNLLPDGNYDDLSQHGSNAVLRGEKWLANLWVSKKIES